MDAATVRARLRAEGIDCTVHRDGTLTAALDPEDLARISTACADASNRFDDEIDRRDAEGAA